MSGTGVATVSVESVEQGRQAQPRNGEEWRRPWLFALVLVAVAVAVLLLSVVPPVCVAPIRRLVLSRVQIGVEGQFRQQRIPLRIAVEPRGPRLGCHQHG